MSALLVIKTNLWGVVVLFKASCFEASEDCKGLAKLDPLSMGPGSVWRKVCGRLYLRHQMALKRSMVHIRFWDYSRVWYMAPISGFILVLKVSIRWSLCCLKLRRAWTSKVATVMDLIPQSKVCGSLCRVLWRARYGPHVKS